MYRILYIWILSIHTCMFFWSGHKRAWVSNIKKSNIAFKFLNRNESSNAKYGTFH